MIRGGLKTKSSDFSFEANKPIISVITVVYNGESSIENTILSVLNQKYRNIEYIIIDGGSKDSTIEILKKYDNYISYWQSEPDKGIYDAMNKGLSFVTGDFFYFLGADDQFFSENTVMNVVEKIDNLEKIYYGNVLFQPMNKLYSFDFNFLLLSKINICHQSIFYPKSVSEFKYDLKYKLLADYHLNIVLYGMRGNDFVHIDEIIANYSLDGISSNAVDENFSKDFLKIYEASFGKMKTILALIYRKFSSKKSTISGYKRLYKDKENI